MEEKINVAEILKHKPQGTKLYDLLYNIDVELDTISTTDTETVVWCTNETDNNTTCHRGYSEFGTVRGCSDGLQILLPSKEMRDWSKFAWKRGDVLVTEDGSTKVIFECFEDDTYLTFKGKYCLQKTNIDETFIVDTNGNLTECFSLQAKNIAQIYLYNIEDRTGGRLNMETLEIEKPAFKDGDILLYKSAKFTYFSSIFILDTNRNEMRSYVRFSIGKGSIDYDVPVYNLGTDRFRYATEEEKQQLFDALAKEGKAWDAKKKQIVDLKPKCEFKPFDKVLSRRCSEDYWVLNFYSHKTDYYHVCIDGSSNLDCIPYNEETAHLLGTTDEWKGGEG